MKSLFDSVAYFRASNSAPKASDSTVFYILEYHIMVSPPRKIMNPVWNILVTNVSAWIAPLIDAYSHPLPSAHANLLASLHYLCSTIKLIELSKRNIWLTGIKNKSWPFWLLRQANLFPVPSGAFLLEMIDIDTHKRLQNGYLWFLVPYTTVIITYINDK